jgi:hypothetical protein
VPKQKTAEPIRVTTIGLDERSQEVLRIAFSSASKGTCILSDDATADVAICNMDSSDAKVLWHKNSVLHPDRPVVVISVKDPCLDNSIYVSKPINITTLITSIKQANHNRSELTFSKISNATAAHTQQHIQSAPPQPRMNQDKNIVTEEPPVPDGQWQDESDTVISYFSPTDYLQGQLQEAYILAKSKKTAVQLSIKLKGSWSSITLDPSQNKIISEIDNEELKSLCTTPICCIETRSKLVNNNAFFETNKSDKPSIEDTNEQFLWKIALWTSAGRLPQGMTPSHLIQLKHWPNLTRLIQSPNDIRISALLTEQPSAPALIAKVLGIPITHVFSFYAASHALGLATSVTRKSAQKPSFNIPQKSKHHSLFGKILNKFSN